MRRPRFRAASGTTLSRPVLYSCGNATRHADAGAHEGVAWPVSGGGGGGGVFHNIIIVSDSDPGLTSAATFNLLTRSFASSRGGSLR